MNDFSQVGERIRLARQSQGRSLRALARDAHVSPSLLSQIETGKIRPSVRTLYQLASNLGLSVDGLLRQAPASGDDAAAGRRAQNVTQKAAENTRVELTTGVTWERLANGGREDLETLRVTYASGASSSMDGIASVHPGWEFAVIIDGELTLEFEDDTPSVLVPGDSLSFDSRRPHRYVNNGARDATALFVVMHDSAATGASATTAADPRTHVHFPDAEVGSTTSGTAGGPSAAD